MGSKQRASARRERQRIEVANLIEARKNYNLCLNCGNEVKQIFLLVNNKELCERCLSIAIAGTRINGDVKDINTGDGRYG